MVRKASKKTMRNKLDKLWSQIIRARGECQRCGKPTNLQAAHINSRRHLAIRYDLDNGLCLCAGCHMWGHHSPTKFTFWLEDYLGRDLLEELHEKNVPTYGKFDWDKEYEFLKDIWNKIQ